MWLPALEVSKIQYLVSKMHLFNEIFRVTLGNRPLGKNIIVRYIA